MVLYEYPFNERVRTLLRLESLFESLFYFLRQESAHAHHVATSVLFEILDVSARADLKSDLLQDLERYRQSLNALRDHPGIDVDTLNTMLASISKATEQLAHQGKAGMALRQNEWLTSLRSRLSIPGGACEFDMPSFHAWKHLPAGRRSDDLLSWARPLLPIYEGLSIVLKLLRESGRKVDVVAEHGVYQKMLGGKAYQLLRVYLPDQAGLYPEASANKYMISIRLYRQTENWKSQVAAEDLSFELALCTTI